MRCSRRDRTQSRLALGVAALAAALCVIGLCAWSVYAQAVDGAAPPSTLVPDYRWMHFAQHPGGLMSNDVWSIATTGDAVWVGTDVGVSVYDGDWVNFAVAASERGQVEVDEDADPVVPIGVILALAVGEDGSSILAGAEQGIAYKWDGARWAEIAALDAPIQAIVEMGGVVLLGTDAGVYMTTPDADAAERALEGNNVLALERIDGRVFAGTDAGLWRLTDGVWEAVQIDDGVPRAVYAISATEDGGLALGTPDAVYVLDSNLRIERRLPVNDELGRPALVQALTDDAYGRLWAGTDGAGAYEFSADGYAPIPHGQAHDANVTIRYVRDVGVDTDGSVWFGTPTGVYRYQVGMWYSDVQGASVADPLNHINDLLVASDGALWIATGGAGVRRKPAIDETETVYGPDQGVPSTVLTLAEDAQGELWAGTFYGLFRFANGEWTLPVVNERLPALTVTALLFDASRLWIGTEAGLAVYDMDEASVRVIEAFDGLSVEALALDGLARLWVGTKTEGAWVREADGGWTQHVHDAADDKSIPGDYVINSGLAADWRTPGHMWALISREGLVHWDGERWTREDTGNQIPVNLLWMLESEENPGRLWIGSEGGVTQFDGETWGTLSQDDGLQSATAYAIARAQDGGHWIGGATGLSYYRPDQTPPWVRVEVAPGDKRAGVEEELRVPYGDELALAFSAGDLQTIQPKLYVVRRLSGPTAPIDAEAGDEIATAAWISDMPGTLALSFPEAGSYELEIVARDQSFNYSDALRVPVDVFVPPPFVDVPGLGPVDPTTFRTLLFLSVASILGAGYILFEVMSRRQRSVEALNRGFNPYISGEPVRTREMFFGRRELVQRIADTLHNNSVMIHGERRIGKTTLLFQLTTLLRNVDDPDYWFVPVYVDLEGTPQHDFFHLLIEEIVLGVLRLPGAREELMPRLEKLEYRNVSGSDYDDRALHRDLREVIDALRAYGQEHHAGKYLRLILLLDEMDVMSQYDSIVQQQLRRIFMREFASTVGAVVAGILISKEWDRIESPWYNMFNEIELEPFTEDEANALLIEPVAGYYRYEDDALQFILARSEGRPYRVQQYGLEAVNHMLAHRRRKVRLQDAEEAHVRIASTPDNRGLPASSETRRAAFSPSGDEIDTQGVPQGRGS